MSFTKHDVWEHSKTISSYLAGDRSLEEAAKASMEWQSSVPDEDRERLSEYTKQLTDQIAALSSQLASTVDQIFLLEELPESISMWRVADLTKYLGACQRYDTHELLVSAVLAQPNVAILFDQVEPAYGDE